MQSTSTSTSNPNTLPPVIRASEIGQYVFCHRAWWLGTVQGYRPFNDAALRGGMQAHVQHGRVVAASRRWRWLGYMLWAIGALLLAVLLFGSLGGNL